MFDIDGTLVQSYDVDTQCFVDAVREVTGLSISSDWSTYQHVTDSGILNEVLVVNSIADAEATKIKVKQCFLKKLKLALAQQPLNEILGAAALLEQLELMDNVVISLATGGWQDSARMKLQSAGINFPSIPLVSADDHYSRIEIMTLAAERMGSSQYPCTYFGDGIWDKEACEHLNYNFILVGDKCAHSPSIKHFQPIQSVLSCIGL